MLIDPNEIFKQSTFTLTLDAVNKLRKLAAITDKNKSELVREGIDLLLEKYVIDPSILGEDSDDGRERGQQISPADGHDAETNG